MFFQLPEVELKSCSVPPVQSRDPKRNILDASILLSFSTGSVSFTEDMFLGQHHKLHWNLESASNVLKSTFRIGVGRRLSYVHRTHENLPIRKPEDHDDRQRHWN